MMILNAKKKFSTEDKTNKFKPLRQENFCFRQGGWAKTREHMQEYKMNTTLKIKFI